MGFVPAKMVWKPLEGAAGNVAERLKERFGAFGATLGNERELEEFFWRFFFCCCCFCVVFFERVFGGFPKTTSKIRQNKHRNTQRQDSEIFQKREKPFRQRVVF